MCSSMAYHVLKSLSLFQVLSWSYGVISGQKLCAARVIVDTVALHNPEQLNTLSQSWYAGNQLVQPLGNQEHYHAISFMHTSQWEILIVLFLTASDSLVPYPDSVNAYFGSSMAFYFSFLDFYTWSLLPPAVLGLSITYFSGLLKQYICTQILSNTAL